MSIIDEIILNGNAYDIVGSGSGMPEDFKQTLHDILEKVAYIDGEGQDYLDALDDAMWPPAPPAEVSYITAVYTQSGTVYDTDSLNSLKADLVVTAHYSNGTTGVVTHYTLSGTLTEGSSTITVSYGGKTTTFNVMVTTLQLIEEIVQMTLATKVNKNTGIVEVNSNSISSDYIEVVEGMNYISTSNMLGLTATGQTNGGHSGAFYNDSQTYISGFDSYWWVPISIPNGAKYVRINADKISQRETERFGFFTFLVDSAIRQEVSWSNTPNGTINAGSGNIQTSGGDAYIAYNIQIDNGMNGIFITQSASYNYVQIAFYDSNNNYLSGKNANAVTNPRFFQIPENAATFAIQAHPYDSSSHNPNEQISVYFVK